MHDAGMLQFRVCFNASDVYVQMNHLRKIGVGIKNDFAKMSISIIIGHNKCEKMIDDTIILFER